MPDTIRDGKGRGYLAEVDGDNFLRVWAQSIPHMHYHSDIEKSAYSIHFHFEQAVDDTWEGCGYITYTGDKQLIVSKAIGTTEDVTAADFSGFAFYFDPTGLSGGASLTPVNMNLQSANTLDATVAHNDDGTAVSSSADGTHFLCFRVPDSGSFELDFQDAVILGKNNTVWVKARIGDAGVKGRITILVFEEEAE
jgi:hypothetical protein